MPTSYLFAQTFYVSCAELDRVFGLTLGVQYQVLGQKPGVSR
jgi:hypothetical protein